LQFLYNFIKDKPKLNQENKMAACYQVIVPEKNNHSIESMEESDEAPSGPFFYCYRK